MTESKTLLSQNEIDALIYFLERHEDTSIGKVLDQNSIDKLVEIIKYNNNKGIFLNKNVRLDIAENIDKASVLDNSGNEVNSSECEVILKEENGSIKVLCIDNKNEYPIFPECLTNTKYVNEGSSWGKAVAPSTLLAISRLFDIKCGEKTLDMARRLFAKVMYGDENTVLPDYYLK